MAKHNILIMLMERNCEQLGLLGFLLVLCIFKYILPCLPVSTFSLMILHEKKIKDLIITDTIINIY